MRMKRDNRGMDYTMVSMGVYLHLYTSYTSIPRASSKRHRLVGLKVASLLLKRLDIEFGTQRNDPLWVVLRMGVEVVFLDIYLCQLYATLL